MKNRFSIYSITLVAVVILFSGFLPPNKKVKHHQVYASWADSVFYSLTPSERIAQLIIVAAYSNRDQKHIDEVSSTIKKYNVGGLLFFQGGPMRQAYQTNFYQSQSKTPLLVSIDGEWGLGMRLDSTISYPREMLLGAISNDTLIYQMGYQMALQFRAMGIHLNFAPVVDVNNNPLNPVINNRSFGENKYLVARKGVSYMRGMQAGGLLTTAKHFPGHGDTNQDSHLTLPVILSDTTRLDTLELYPFRELIRNGVSGVMVAHLFIPALDTTRNVPSTMSGKVVTGLLRRKMGFNGLIFTDALAQMKGVTEFFKPGEREVKALEAGNDVLLMVADVPKAMAAIEEAVASGRLRQSQIDSSCRKILEAKERVGLHKQLPVNLATLTAKIKNPEAAVMQRKLIEQGLTLIQNQNNLIPFRRLDTLRMAVVLIGSDKNTTFKETLSLYQGFDAFYLTKQADSLQVDSLYNKLKGYNLIVAGVVNTDFRPTKNFGVAPNAARLLDTLVQTNSVVLDFFATPYALTYFKYLEKYKAILVSYDDSPLAQDLSVQLLFGAIGAHGRLPVSVGCYPATTGIVTEGALRLRYGIPEEIGIDSRKLAEIDSIIADAIRQKAMPGCQILAAKDGVVFYNKAFGFHTYDTTQRVLKSDIYDIASITKIAGTLPVVMKLYEGKNIDLNEKISKYLPELKKTNKKNITLIDLLTHQAQLTEYIPFYLRTIEPAVHGESITASAWSEKYPYKQSNSQYANKNIRYRVGLYTSVRDEKHTLPVADSLFMLNTYRDTIWNLCAQSALAPVKKYMYSDMGFYYMYWMTERILQKPMNQYVAESFYSKLGATTLGYLPLNRFDKLRIVPTENDVVFRKQLVRGFVHDPGAAMMGGVGGHAGVFSNANDLAKLMQMYLNKGVYGGEQYLKASTLDYFTSCPFCNAHNRRGIGFDKPEVGSKIGPTCDCVSAKTFGHQGFTGCVTWADPESGLLYIFLSNRVYPDASVNKLAALGVRTRIQEVLAKCLAK